MVSGRSVSLSCVREEGLPLEACVCHKEVGSWRGLKEEKLRI